MGFKIGGDEVSEGKGKAWVAAFVKRGEAGTTGFRRSLEAARHLKRKVLV